MSLQAYSSPLEDPNIHPEEIKLIVGNEVPKLPVKTIPWGLILSKPPVWALITCHFCHNWGTFILLTWMPTYYNQVNFLFVSYFTLQITSFLERHVVSLGPLGVEVQSHRIWTFLCIAVAYNGILGKSRRLDR